MSKHEQEGRRRTVRVGCMIHYTSGFLAQLATSLKQQRKSFDCQWETRKPRLMNEAKRKQKAECQLTLCGSLQVNTGGVGCGCCVFTPLLPYNTVQTAPYRNANTNTLVWNIWLHHIQQIWVAREGGRRERDTPWGPLISLLWPSP